MPVAVTPPENAPLRFIETLRSSSFQLAAMLAALFVFCTLVLFAFVYWQTTLAETTRIRSELTNELEKLEKLDDAAMTAAISDRLVSPAHKLNFAQLFSVAGQPLAGNIPAMPNFKETTAVEPRHGSTFWLNAAVNGEKVMLVGKFLPDGKFLVIGRSLDSLENLGHAVRYALELGFFPALILALTIGAIVSRQTHARIRDVLNSVNRIMEGNIKERLPVRNSKDDLDHLSASVNLMLDEIERLLNDAKSTGDNIAHDLRTPLTRVRARLERACQNALSQEELSNLVEHAITGLDQTLRIITALLRIGQIENRRQRSNFTSLDLEQLVVEIGDLFEPFAEEKNIRFVVRVGKVAKIIGDRDLLSEAIANMVENALKFTQSGNKVLLELLDLKGVPTILVIDDGPGIPAEDLDNVWMRFYRSDKSRHIDGNGLGLSLVKAIADLHGFTVSVQNANPGCRFEIRCAKTESRPRSFHQTDGAGADGLDPGPSTIV